MLKYLKNEKGEIFITGVIFLLFCIHLAAAGGSNTKPVANTNSSATTIASDVVSK